MGDNKGPVLVVNTCVFGGIALALVCIRLWFRITRRRFDSSDVCIGLALVFAICQDTLNLICILKYGYGQHRADLPPSIRTSMEPPKLFYVNRIIFKLTTSLCKISLCLVYRTLFPSSAAPLIYHTRCIVNFTLLLILGAYGSAFLISIFQCTPISKAWDSKILGNCIDATQFRYSTALFNIITSVLVIGTPLPALWSMKDKRPEVNQLLILILLGLAHTGCTISRFVIMFYPSPDAKTDPQWANNIPNTIAMVEMNVGLIAATLVVMRPAFHAIYARAITPFSPIRSDSAASSAEMNVHSGGQVPSHLVRSLERKRQRERENKRRGLDEISTFDIDTTVDLESEGMRVLD